MLIPALCTGRQVFVSSPVLLRCTFCLVATLGGNIVARNGFLAGLRRTLLLPCAY